MCFYLILMIEHVKIRAIIYNIQGKSQQPFNYLIDEHNLLQLLLKLLSH